MPSNASFFYNKTINIFTDASCIELRPKKINVVKATSPGFVGTYAGRILATGLEVYLSEHSMFGEAKAIELAVEWCKVAASRGLFLPEGYSILSDNAPNIQKIYGLLTSWFDASNQGKTNDIVRLNKITNAITWDDLVFNAALSIFTSGLPIRLFYVSAHSNLRPFSPIKPKEKFLRVNNPMHGDMTNDIDEVILHDFATFNNIVDIMTRNYLTLHKTSIENDIDTYFDTIDISCNKIQPVRWPFITYKGSPLLLNQYLI